MAERARNRRLKRGHSSSSSQSTASTPPAADGTSAPAPCKWGWWHAGLGSRKKPLEDYRNPRKIPVAVRAEFDKLRKRYEAGGLRNGANIKNIGDGIYELRYADTGNTPYRLLFMRWGDWAIVLDVFKKTTDATPKERAVKRRGEWLATFGSTPAS